MDGRLRGTVKLPGSKSESNRALMIAAYGGFPLEVAQLSNAHDTVLLKALLEKVATVDHGEVDCEDAGTASRFMMTYLACRPGTWLLTGDARMRQRPMAPLIEAVRSMGADLECLGEEGFLPVRIKGRRLVGGSVEIDASSSSQFVSSLLMAAPTWEKGLKLHLKDAVSLPYIDMTISIMLFFGAVVECDGDWVVVRHGSYQPRPFSVSSDWSAASYWYEMAALSECCDLLLEGLAKNTYQGDSKVAELFKVFGVQSRLEKEGVRLSKTAFVRPSKPLSIDVADTPDLFPALFVTCVALQVSAVIKGVKILSYKESDRVESLVTELLKYYHIEYILENNEINLISSSLIDHLDDETVFHAHDDHRVVMALAPLSLLFGGVSFDHPEAVNKSYPGFWSAVEALF